MEFHIRRQVVQWILYQLKPKKKYKETVQPYLDKRNGKGWENRMEKEIENIKKTPLK
ncbi:FEKKY domain-containing protein [Chryseobacterium proteolyticum]